MQHSQRKLRISMILHGKIRILMISWHARLVIGYRKFLKQNLSSTRIQFLLFPFITGQGSRSRWRKSHESRKQPRDPIEKPNFARGRNAKLGASTAQGSLALDSIRVQRACWISVLKASDSERMKRTIKYFRQNKMTSGKKNCFALCILRIFCPVKLISCPPKRTIGEEAACRFIDCHTLQRRTVDTPRYVADGYFTMRREYWLQTVFDDPLAFRIRHNVKFVSCNKGYHQSLCIQCIIFNVLNSKQYIRYIRVPIFI